MNQKKDNGCKMLNALFDSQKNFIVIGLCGLTGSGCSTVAKILQKEFNDLKMPTEDNDQENDAFKRHEYKKLYTFAQMNWRSFSRIKVSALITAHLLDDGFKIEDLINEIKIEQNVDEIKEAVNDFENKEFEFDITEWKSINHRLWENGVDSVETNKARDENGRDQWGTSEEVEKNEASLPDILKEEYAWNVRGEVIERNDQDKVIINNKALYKLLKDFKASRESKRNFENELRYWVLKEYIFDKLPKATEELWSKIGNISVGLPDIIMQFLALNLRIGGKPILNLGKDQIESKGYFTIAEDINLSIKLLRIYQKSRYDKYKKAKSDDLDLKIHSHTLVVIDSIKNPFESMYLKQRYSNYYLMGVYTETNEREQRLLKIEKMTPKDMVQIDQVETLKKFREGYNSYLKKKNEDGVNNQSSISAFYKIVDEWNLVNQLQFILQNVSSCLEEADIFVNNYRDNDSYIHLKKTLLRYVSLIMYPGLVLPTPMERCMQTAFTAKVNSGCISRQVGAVITDKNFCIKSIGWNQQPEGQLPCSYRDLSELCNHFSEETYSDYENGEFQETIKRMVEDELEKKETMLNKKGRMKHYCFKDIYNKMKKKDNQVHTRSLHAEETAFLNLESTIEAKEGYLFTTSSPCELCAKKAIHLGIARIYYIEPYPGISFAHVLSAGPNKGRPERILLTGAVGRAYMQLYTPLLPIKDEMSMWMEEKMENILFPNTQEE